MMTKKNTQTLTDPQGNEVLKKYVKPIDLKRDNAVRRAHKIMMNLRIRMEKAKREVIEIVSEYETYSREKCGAPVGGKKGNLTLTSFDGQIKIERANQDFITFDERLSSAVDLIHECVNAWSDAIKTPILPLINKILTPNASGKLPIKGLLSLKQINIPQKDSQFEKWETAMRLINDSMQVFQSKSYHRLLVRNPLENKFTQVCLDFAAIIPETKEK
jgi:hypothetical protein